MLQACRLGLLTCCAAVLISTSAWAQAPEAEPTTWRPAATERWSLRKPDAMATPVFRGLASQDKSAGAAGQIMYPGANAGGFLVAILTHALINESVKNAQRTALQKEADKVLEPFKPALDVWSAEDLMLRTQTQLATLNVFAWDRFEPTSAIAASWVIETAPVFAVAPDQRALIVDAQVAITRHGDAQPAHKTIVRVVGQPRTEADVVGAWTANGGEFLKTESASLHARAIALAMGDLLGQFAQKDARQRTVRYAQGGEEIIERATVLEQQCDRLVVRALRGDLMSVPAVASAANCPPPVASAQAVPGAAPLTEPTAPIKN